MGKTLQGYATEAWVLKKLAKLPKAEVQRIEQQTGAPLSELLKEYFEEKEDPNATGKKIYMAKQAKNADTVDNIHINYGYTRETYQELVAAGLDDPNTLYLIKK